MVRTHPARAPLRRSTLARLAGSCRVAQLHLGRLGRVRRYRSVQLSIIEAQPIIFDSGTTPGCLPTARGGARGRVIHTAPEALVRSSQPLHF